MSTHSKSNSTSTQSTPPTPPNGNNNGRRGRRLRKSTTPMKSAEKLEQHERVTVHQVPSLAVSPSDITPSSSGTTTPAKQDQENGKPLVNPSSSLTTPIPIAFPTFSGVKKNKRAPYTLIEVNKGKTCPTAGCNGMGHATGQYTMHYAESGCPIAAQLKKEMEKTQSPAVTVVSKPKRTFGRKRRKRRSHHSLTTTKKPLLVDAIKKEPSNNNEAATPSTHDQQQTDTKGINVEEILSSLPTPTGGVLGKRKRIPYTLVEANKGNKCPTEGCNGIGHITGLYAMHYAVSGCPLAHGKTAEECKMRRDEMNKVKYNSTPVVAATEVEQLYSLSGLLLQPRKTPRLQAARNLSVSLENIAGSSPTMTPQLSRISQQPISGNQMTPVSERVPEYHRPLPEPNLEGITPTQELILFREAQRKMREDLGINSETKDYQLSKISMGSYEIDTWYPSPYSREFTQLKQIFICEYCLRYYRSVIMLEKHETKCLEHKPHPPGREIYRKYKYSIFEVDGEDHKEYCQNLCLLAKLFLDHKTLYFDVEPFLFYILTEHDKKGCHLIGYFSKEKHSSQGYNVSCILTLPQYMRKGYGRMLIDFSYLLTRLEEKVGSPERPLSDLGLVSYRSYWKNAILTYLIKNSSKNGSTLSIKEMSQETGILPEDIISTLQYFGLLKYWKSKHIIIKKKDLLEEQSQKIDESKESSLTLDSSCLKWTPTPYPMYS